MTTPDYALQYVGRYPDSGAVICPKSYADATAASNVVTTAYVNQQIASAAASLTTQSYVNAQNALLAQKTAVTTADSAYIPLSQLGAPNGVASVDANTELLTTQIPTSGLITNRTATSYSLLAPSAGLLGATISSIPGTVTNTQLVTTGSIIATTLVDLTTGQLGTELGEVNVEDPGWPWRPIPLGFISGTAYNANDLPANRMTGTGGFGLVTVAPPLTVSDQVYGIALCTGSSGTNTYPILPYAIANQTPTSVPAITGALTLNLYAGVGSGSQYTYLAANLVFSILVVPAI